MLHFIKKFIPRPFLQVYHFCLAELAAWWYGHPSEKLIVVGITGTGGKSTTVFLLTKILEAAGWKVGATSTLFFKIGEREWLNDKKMTMLGRFQTQKMLRQMVEAGCQAAIVETTSQGLEQYRHIGINYDIAVLTNLYPEHLDAHGGFENYKQAKGKLFAALSQGRGKPSAPPKTIIVNGDDENAAYFLSFPAERKIVFKLADAQEIKLDGVGTHFVLEGAVFDAPLLGRFNLYNILCAIAIARALGLSLSQIQPAIKNLPPIPGRLEFIDNGQPFKIIVDYAYEPKAMAGLYETLKMVPHQRVIHVFGSAGGGRDRARRPILGKMAAQNARYVIITNEDPYDENPHEIINQIAAGAVAAGKKEGDNLFKILDRRQAIHKALSLARENDLVLITGKGAEQAICAAGGKKVKWDDREAVKEELKLC